MVTLSRHLTLLFSEVTGLTELTGRVGDLEASRAVGRLLALQEIIVTREGAGQVVQSGADTLYAVFGNASAALNRALEIQRIVEGSWAGEAEAAETGRLRVRLGLHTGEVFVKEGERFEVIGRHVTRGRRVMEAAAPGQILASEEVTKAAADLVEIPKEFLAIEYFGEFYLKGVGATALCEVADLRFRRPEAPRLPEGRSLESALVGRLELAGYRAQARLGEGPHGVVYQAEETGTGRRVAIKVLDPLLVESGTGRGDFAAELERVRRLGLDGVVAVAGERLDHQPPFIVMEMVTGRPIDAALEGASADRIGRVFRAVGDLLAPAHAAGLIHGNLKPGNVLIREDDRPVLLDFGTSALGDQDRIGGRAAAGAVTTPASAAPEQIRGEPRTAQVDLYALGVLLFRVLTGRDPFGGESIHEVVEAHLHEDPPLPGMLRAGVADGLQRICLKALEKDPADRYASAQAMVGDLERFIRGETVRTRPSAYDNLLYHRVQQHVAQIEEWAGRGLLNREEQNRLIGAYEGLQRRGLPAVMEGRQYRFWQTVVYLGGWSLLNGVLFWLVRFWDELGRGTKLALGAVPVLTAAALAVAMWRLERFRLTFVALIVAVLAVPLGTGVWLHEFELATKVSPQLEHYELFPRPETGAESASVEGPVASATAERTGGAEEMSFSYPVTNRQLWWSALAALLAGWGVMLFTRTTTHSAQGVVVTVLFYSASLLWWGLRPSVLEEDWAWIGLKCVPLIGVMTGVAGWLINRPGRRGQAAPWNYGAALLLIAVCYALSLDLPEELGWADLDHAGTFLLLAGAGAAQVWIGLAARARLRHLSRGATWLVIFVGLLNVLAGLALAGLDERWPQGWWGWRVFEGVSEPVPMAHLLMPLVSLSMAMLACRYQMFSFLLVGLAGFAGSVHLLGLQYFTEVQAWPRLMILLGACGLGGALVVELRRTRGNTLDDVVTRSRL
jgi:serine/threonine protein kinase/class 3 adenylate cyclase